MINIPPPPTQVVHYTEVYYDWALRYGYVKAPTWECEWPTLEVAVEKAHWSLGFERCIERIELNYDGVKIQMEREVPNDHH